jgi:type II secretory pathway pseudopilin PulG
MRVWPLSEENRRTGGFSAVELLLGIAIVVVMVILLLPVLGEVRSNANKRASQGELHQLYNALMRYSRDYSGYTPVACTVNGGDYPYTMPGQTFAGREVWGITPAYISPNGATVTSYSGEPPKNIPLGYGVLAAEDYVKTDLLWTRSDRSKNEAKMY